MKKIILSAFVLTICLGSIAQTKPKTSIVKTTSTNVAPPIFKNLLDSFSYMAGYNVATNMNQQGITEINTALMKKGIDDYLNKAKPALDPAKGNEALQREIGLSTAKKNAADKIKVEADKAKGVAFLETNKKRKEVVTLPDGLQYEVIKQGEAAAHKPIAVDTVVVNYIGMLMD
jgi:FKBP-type peptidyl-prolyl cis-trans isomerase FklB